MVNEHLEIILFSYAVNSIAFVKLAYTKTGNNEDEENVTVFALKKTLFTRQYSFKIRPILRLKYKTYLMLQ